MPWDPRIVSTGILAALLLVLVATAGPAHGKGAFGLAGRMETGAGYWDYGSMESFEWYEFVGEHVMESADRISLLFAIVPFEGALTSVGLDAIGGTTFWGLVFEDGQVVGLPYRTGAWTTVQATLDFSTGHSSVSVDGRTAGPLPFAHPSSSVQAFRINAGSRAGHSVGWIDTVWIVHDSPARESLLFEATFDDGRSFPLYQGTLTAATPPFSDSSSPEEESGPASAGPGMTWFVAAGIGIAVAIGVLVAIRLRHRP